MKITLKIVRYEWLKVFYSPIAWILVVIFFVQVAYQFTSNLERLEGYQQLNNAMLTSDLTLRIFKFESPYGVFRVIKNNIFLYIPLITMSLFSKEYASGSIKLLDASPVNNYQIVYGKYLAMVLYALLLTLIVLFLATMIAFFIPAFVFSYVFSGLIGFFLLASTYLAVGLFISSLTTSQVTAAVATFAVLGFIEVTSGVGQDIPLISDVLYWIGISSRAEQIMKGLISSKNVVYFLVVILTFLMLTILRLNGVKKSQSLYVKFLRFFLLFAFAFFSAYISSVPKYVFYKDMTRGERMTISKQARQVTDKLQGQPLALNTYINLINKHIYKSGLPWHRNYDIQKFEDFVRFLPQLDFSYTYFYDSLPGNISLYNQNKGLSTRSIARNLAGAYGISFDRVLSPEELKKVVDLSPEGNDYVRQLVFNGKTSFLRMYDDTRHYPLEQETASALKRLVTKPPVIGIVTGHGERGLTKKDRDYYAVLFARQEDRRSLVNGGFSVTTVTLDSRESLREVDILLIADPVSPYRQEELDIIKRYLNEGGNMLVAGELERKAYIQPVFDLLGLQYKEGALKSNNPDYSEDMVFVKLEPSLEKISAFSNYRYGNVTYDRMQLYTAGILASDDNSEFTITPFLTPRHEDNLLVQDPKVLTNPGFDAVAFGLTREINNKQQRIIVMADADFLSNAEYGRSKGKANHFRGFIYPAFHWFAYEEFPVIKLFDKTKKKKDGQLLMDQSGVRRFRWMILYAMPAILMVGASFFLYARHRT